MNRTILLVGASGGVGQATAKHLIDRGYQVIATVLDEADGARTRVAVPGLTDIASIDLSDAVKARTAFEAILSRRGLVLGAVVSAAGISPCGPVEITPLDEFRKALEVNAIANAALYQASLPFLRLTRGRMIFVSSYAGKVGSPLLGYYTASKHALEGLAEVMRLEAGKWGVEIVLIEPGGVRTPMLSGFMAAIDRWLGGLSDIDRRNYGPLFQQFRTAGTSGADMMLSPEMVAETVRTALESPTPKTRYVIGSDAIEFIRQRGELADRDMDANFRELFPALKPDIASA